MFTSEIYLINPPDNNAKNHITKDMAGGFGFDAGRAVSLPPLELVYHALSLKKAGYQINFFDFQVWPEKIHDFLDNIEKKDDLFFLILVTVPTIKDDLEFIRKIKSNKDAAKIYVKIGLKNEIVFERILKTGLVNKILFGETENIINEIIAQDNNNGCAYLKDGMIVYGSEIIINNMEELPDFDVNFIDITRYKYLLLPIRSGNFFSFQSSRGCPFSCSYYCPYPLIQGKKWRAMSVEKLFKNMKLLVEKYHVRAVLFRDATFTLDKKRTLEFCSKLINHKLDMSWWCESRINCLDEEIIKKMSEAGCRGINLGVETGDDQLMQSQGKAGADINQLIKIKNLANKYQIKLHFLLIVGLPDESKQTLYNTFLLIKKLKPESMGITNITPYPGTSLYHDAIKNKWILDQDISNYIGNKVVMKTRNLNRYQISHGRFLLQLAGYLNHQKFWVCKYLFARLLKIYFYLWKII